MTMAMAPVSSILISEGKDMVKEPGNSDLIEIESDASTACSVSEYRKLTRAQVLSLAGELLEGFSAASFQEELQALLKHSDAWKTPGRMQLTLKVQSQVLPKYGFPGTSDGVVMMLLAVAPFLGHWLVNNLIEQIDEKLGLPRGTTHSACTDMQAVQVQADGFKKQTSSGSHPEASLESLSTLTTKSKVSLTRKQVLSMATELLEGFSTEEFQQKLQVLLRNRKSIREVPGRIQLALTVQSKVLPKYGFAGTSLGIVTMLDAISQFSDDWTVQYLLWAIDDKLGMNA